MKHNPRSIRLTKQQAEELETLAKQYRECAVHPSERAIRLGMYLNLCLWRLLWKTRPEIAKEFIKRVRDGLRVLESERHLGRIPSADELISELVRVVTVPPWLAEAIRRDFEMLQN